MIVEGKNQVKEALSVGATVEKIYIAKTYSDAQTNAIVDLAKEKKLRINFVDKFILDKLSPTGKHQGVLCYTTEYKYYEIEDILNKAKEKGKSAFILVLDGIEDPHNLGSIIRSAECGDVDGIIIPRHRACSVNDTVVKVSEGASQHVMVAMVTNINDAIKLLKDEFVNVYAADMDGDSVYDVHLDTDLALVIGGEGDGVKRLTRSLCDKVVSLPLLGKINSLNASNAASILIYEVVRQRTLGLKIHK